MIRVTLNSGQEIAFAGDTFQVEHSGNLGIFDKGGAQRAAVADGEWTYVARREDKAEDKECPCGR